MQQVLFYIPLPWTIQAFPHGLPIYGFGMMLFIAFILCTWIAGRRGEKEGISYETIQDVALWIFLGGIIGARILYLVEDPNQHTFWEILQQLPKIWDGGIILYGAVLGALVSYGIAYLLIFRKQHLSTLRLADVLAPSIALGLALGRIGCFLNGCCYGQVACADCAVVPVHFPLSAPARYFLVDDGLQTAAGFTFADPGKLAFGAGARIGQVEKDSAAWNAGLRPGDVIEEIDDRTVRSPEDVTAYLTDGKAMQGKQTLKLKVNRLDAPVTFVPRTIGLLPTQLYETISMFLLFLFLTALYPLRKTPGQIVAVLMFCYGLHRYCNELLRIDPRPKGIESYTSLVLIAAGLLMTLWLLFRPTRKLA